MAKHTTTTIRIEPILLAKLKLCADRKRISMNKMANEFLKEGVERMEGTFDPAITRSEGLKILNTVRDIGAEKTILNREIIEQMLNSLFVSNYFLHHESKAKKEDKLLKKAIDYATKKTDELVGNAFDEE